MKTNRIREVVQDAAIDFAKPAFIGVPITAFLNPNQEVAIAWENEEQTRCFPIKKAIPYEEISFTFSPSAYK